MEKCVTLESNVYSIKVDTNFDNVPMLRILDKLGYVYCGEVFFRGSARKAFEKVLRSDGESKKLHLIDELKKGEESGFAEDFDPESLLKDLHQKHKPKD